MLLDGNLTELGRLAAGTARFCRDHSLGEDVEFDLNLVLEELFTNSVNHGGCRGMEGAAEFQLTNGPRGVILEYADRGFPFDPLTAPVPDVTAPLHKRPAGGLGVHLIRQIMRDFEYQRSDGWNRIRMLRPIPPAGPKE